MREKKNISPAMTHRTMVALIFLWTTSCGKSDNSPGAESDTAIAWSSISEAFTKSFKKGGIFPLARTDSEMGKLLSGVKLSLRSGLEVAGSNNGKVTFQKSFLAALKDAPAIAPDQTYQIIRTTLEDPDGCAGVSCGRIFGIAKNDINPLMDDLEQAVRSSGKLSETENRSLRDKILSSLQRMSPESSWKRAKKGLTRDGQNFSSLSGTCAVPALQALGLRSLGSYPDFLSRLKGSKSRIDYRNQTPKPSQLSTGACHLFATVELFKHAKGQSFNASKNIDLPYTFAEIWSSKLGLNADDAINKELKFLESLEKAQLDLMQNIMISNAANPSSKSREELFKIAVNEYGLQMRFEGHGNSPLGDFRYLSSNGAVQAGHSLPKVSMEQIETLGEKLALARLRVVEQTVLKQKPMTPDVKKALIEGPIKELFAIAERSRKASRDAVKNELKQVKLELKAFNVSNKPELEQQFFSDLKTFGPIHVDVNSHSTAVVAYDPQKKLFFVRDSDDPLNRPYTGIHQDELFAQLRAYYIMRPKN
jgi:hypothetical protein